MGELAREKGLEVEIGRFEEWRPEGRLFDLWSGTHFVACRGL